MTSKIKDDGKYIYTTGEIAIICKVAMRTVAKWIDSGKLKGRTLPGSKDRRVDEDDLISFMKEFDIKLPDDLVNRSGGERGLVAASKNLPKDSFVFYKDGINWCCVRTDFENLQESNAGFGLSLYEAWQDLLAVESKKGNCDG